MEQEFTFYIRFSGITVRFVLPAPIALPACYSSLLCEAAAADAEYRVELLDGPLCPEGELIHTEGHTSIYRTKKGWLRVFPAPVGEEKCQVACLLCPDGHHKLYYPRSQWAHFASNWQSTPYLGGEKLLLEHDAFLLHSSLVMINGKTVLFCGPSGAGKSTQSALWQAHLGAQILNGDRAVVMKRPEGFYAGGSVWSGTSGIYRREQAPIAGIFLLRQAEENSVEQVCFEAFVPLFSQTLVNSWDSEFMSKVTALYAELLGRVPVYRLNCRPDRQAAELAYQTLFK